MRKTLSAVAAAALIALGLIASAALAGGHPEFVTICHAAGQASGPANFVTLTLPENAVYGQAGHFNENGTPRAGHEQDYLGPCEDDETPTDTTPTDTTPTETTPTIPTPPTQHCVYTGAGKDGNVDAYGGTNDDCAPLPTKTETVIDPTPICLPTEKVVTQVVTKVVPKIVRKTKVKVVYRTKIVTRTVVKIKKVYVPGLHPDGVEGSG